MVLFVIVGGVGYWWGLFVGVFILILLGEVVFDCLIGNVVVLG